MNFSQLAIQLKKKKLRLTEARKAVFDTLFKAKKALSAKEVLARIDQSKTPTDQASVYRNLTLFAQLDLVHQLQSGKYSLCHHEHLKQDHHHVHIMANCTLCSYTYEVPKHTHSLCELTKEFNEFLPNFQKFKSLSLEGVCKTCVAQTSPKEGL